MNKLNHEQIHFSSYSESLKTDVNIKNIVNGSTYKHFNKDTIISVWDYYFFEDTIIPYGNNSSGIFCEYAIDTGNITHIAKGERMNPKKGSTIIYSGTNLASNKYLDSEFGKNSKYKVVSIIPSIEYMNKLIEADYSFSKILDIEINQKYDKCEIFKNIRNINVSRVALNIFNNIGKGDFWDEMIELNSKELLLNLFSTLTNYNYENINIINHLEYTINFKTKLEDVAKEFKISKRSINSIFSNMNTTFKDVKKEIILKKSKELLESGLSTIEVAKYFGFTSIYYFKKYLES